MRTRTQLPTTGNTLEAKAMRRVEQWVSSAYIRLISLVCYLTDETPYGATDGRLLLLNPAGIMKIKATSDPVGYLAFLLLHEALHAMLNHGIRLMGFRDRKLANIAADYVINAIIIKINEDARKAGATADPFPMINGGLYDPDLSGDKSVEMLYRKLLADEAAKPQLPDPPVNQDGGDDDDSDSGDSDSGDMGDNPDGWDFDDDEDGEDGDEGSGSGGSSPDKSNDDDTDSGDERGDGKGGGKGDESDDAEGGDSDGGQHNPDPENGDGQKRVQSDDDDAKKDAETLGGFAGTGDDDGVFTPELDEGETMDDVANTIDDEVQRIALEEEINERAGATMGGPDKGIAGIMKHRKRANIGDWKQAVQDWFTSRQNAGWTKPFNAPVFGSTRLVVAGRESRGMGPIVILFDVSYSVPTAKVAEMLGESQFALDEFKPKSLHLIEIPNFVRRVWELREGDVVPEELNYGGGTAFGPGFDWVYENVPDCEGVIYMTDGDAWDIHDLKQPDFPVLWLDWSCCPEKYPWGEVVVMADLDA